MLTLFCLFYFHPYHGIRHDSILYLGQALQILEPQQFGKDLFFAYGSQSKYTFFPEIIAWLLKYFQPAEIFLTLTLLGLLAFALASVALLRRLFPDAHRWYGLLALLALPAGYGGQLIFGYAEPFFTGRSLAEPVLLLSLALFLSQRYWLAFGLWLVALSIHPLQSLPLLMLVFGYLVLQDRRWWLLLWIMVLMLGLLAWLGLAPFDQLYIQHDPQWNNWIVERTPQVFVSAWRYQDWCYWLTDIFLVWLLTRYSGGQLHQFAGATIIASVMGMLATLILADGLGLVLPTALQLWRTHWLLHWLAMASVPFLLTNIWRTEDAFRSPRLPLLLSIVTFGVPFGSGGHTPFIILGLIPLYIFWLRITVRLTSSTVHKLLQVFPWLLLLLGVVKHCQDVMVVYQRMEGVREAARPEFMLMGYPVIAALVIYTAIFLWRSSLRLRPFLLMVLLAADLHAVDVWDRRNQWTRNIESRQYSPSAFGVKIEPLSQIFWENELLAAWLILGQPSYLNPQQAAGIAFNRGTAVEVVRREKLFQGFLLQQQICQIMNGLNGDNGCQIDDEIVRTLCADSFGPDYFVLTSELEREEPLGSLSIAGGVKGDRVINYKLYGCKKIMAQR